jgi:hypothetical protein
VNTPSTSISPGLGGFIAFFVLAVALWLLMRNMNARMRRMSYRAEEEQKQAEAEARGRRPAGEEDLPTGQDGKGRAGEPGEEDTGGTTGPHGGAAP